MCVCVYSPVGSFCLYHFLSCSLLRKTKWYARTECAQNDFTTWSWTITLIDCQEKDKELTSRDYYDSAIFLTCERKGEGKYVCQEVLAKGNLEDIFNEKSVFSHSEAGTAVKKEILIPCYSSHTTTVPDRTLSFQITSLRTLAVNAVCPNTWDRIESSARSYQEVIQS